MSFFCICVESRIRSEFLYDFARYCRRTYNNKWRKLEGALTLFAGVGYRRANLHAVRVDAPWKTITRNVKYYSNKNSQDYIAGSYTPNTKFELM